MSIVPCIYNGLQCIVPYIYYSIQYTDNNKSIVHDNLIMFYQSYSAYYLKLWLYWHYIPTSINVEKIIRINMHLAIIGTELEGSIILLWYQNWMPVCIQALKQSARGKKQD